MLADTRALSTPPFDFLPNVMEVSGTEFLTTTLLLSSPLAGVRPLEHLAISYLSEELVTLLVERGKQAIPHLKSLTIHATSVDLSKVSHLGACFSELAKFDMQTGWD